jgi:hypothetical protein
MNKFIDFNGTWHEHNATGDHCMYDPYTFSIYTTNNVRMSTAPEQRGTTLRQHVM